VFVGQNITFITLKRVDIRRQNFLGNKKYLQAWKLIVGL